MTVWLVPHFDDTSAMAAARRACRSDTRPPIMKMGTCSRRTRRPTPSRRSVADSRNTRATPVCTGGGSTKSLMRNNFIIQSTRRQEPGTRHQEPVTLERILDRRTLRREQLRAVRGDDHVVLETHAELAADVDARLVAEHHARLHRQRLVPAEHVVLNEIRPLVAVHPHAVADAMAEVLESGSVAGVD